VFNFHKRFLDGMPFYLVRHYWWAYLWQAGVWFFDHQPIINAILFWQYKKLMQTTLVRLGNGYTGRMLQMTCVYGSLTPSLLKHFSGKHLHIMDIASVQLKLARRKSPGNGLIATRMNAECLGYCNHAFDTVVLFFLLHEMPSEARQRAMSEAVRVISPGGRLIVTEYAPLPEHHMLYRFPPFRWILTALEPFLGDFWLEDLAGHFNTVAARHGKKALESWHTDIFGHFYRVREFQVIAATGDERQANRQLSQEPVGRVANLLRGRDCETIHRIVQESLNARILGMNLSGMHIRQFIQCGDQCLGGSDDNIRILALPVHNPARIL